MNSSGVSMTRNGLKTLWSDWYNVSPISLSIPTAVVTRSKRKVKEAKIIFNVRHLPLFEVSVCQ
ncbi:hypothetical protein GC56T3_1886 [Geobacillus sp. C56-T3]|nr:hypothetical protein GC56T3_1886 [Geobacillus sp. C56-T3]